MTSLRANLIDARPYVRQDQRSSTRCPLTGSTPTPLVPEDVKRPGKKAAPKAQVPVVNARVRVGRAQADATIIGVQHGPTQAPVTAAVEQAMESLLAQRRLTIPAVESGDTVTNALFIGRSPTGGDALGFAVNNSGLIVCPTAIGEADTVQHIASKTTHTQRYVLKRNLLSALSIDSKTAGLLPSYRDFTNIGEALFSYDRDGTRVTVTVDAIEVDHVRVVMSERGGRHRGRVRRVSRRRARISDRTALVDRGEMHRDGSRGAR